MIYRLMVLLVAFALAGCWNNTTIQGSGKMQTQTIAAAPFTAVHVEAIADVVIEGGASAPSVSVTADEKFIPYLVSEVLDGTLTLSIKKGVSLQGKALVYHIAMGNLRSFELDGSGKMQATKLSGDKLSLSLSGGGTFDVSGQTDSLAIEINGSGNTDAAGLKAKRAKVEINGSGRVTVNASDALDAEINGSGNIRYIGSPTIKQEVSGSGHISQQASP